MEIRPIVSALLRSKTGAVLIAAQVAITLAILSNAMFLIQARLSAADRPSGVLEPELFTIRLAGIRDIDDVDTMHRRDLEALRAIPGVAHVAGVNQFPLARSGWNTTVSVGQDPDSASSAAALYLSGESMVDTLGLELIAGRDFTPDEIREIDARKSDVVADAVILTRALARALFGDEQAAIGAVTYHGAGESASQLHVVGVVDTLMTPWAQTGPSGELSMIMPVRHLDPYPAYAVRVAPGQRSRAMAAAERELTELRADRVLLGVRSADEIRADRYRADRAGAGILLALTIALLVVTASGVVGIASLWVSQRRKQIGVRRALGARRLDILRYFITENLLITTGGIVCGLVLAVLLNQLMVSELEAARVPAWHLAGGSLALWALGVLAVLGPAWRAAAVPPAVATRSI